MKRVLAVILTLALAFCAIAVPASAASRKFYIPQKIVEYRPSGAAAGTENKPKRNTTDLNYNSASRTLTVSISDPYAYAYDWFYGLYTFLEIESTDSYSNRFISATFIDTAVDRVTDRYFANDLIRYGKIKKIIYKAGTRTQNEYNFKANNGKLLYSQKIEYDESYDESGRKEFTEDTYKYNKDGNISQITCVFRAEEKGFEPTTATMVSQVQYDSKNRPSQIIITFPDDESDTESRRWIYYDYNAKGIPTKWHYVLDQDSESSDQEESAFVFNSQNQLIKDGTTSFSYDSQGRLIKITDSDGSYEMFSNFINV